MQNKNFAQCDYVSSGDTPSSYLSSILFPTGVASGVNYHLSADLTINVNLVITSGSQFYCDDNVEITINPGVTLTINGGSIFNAYSSTMWDGFHVLPANAIVTIPGKIISSGNVLIANAEKGIYIDEEALYMADFNISGNTQFCNNYYGLYIEGYGGVHPGLVEDSEFYADNLISPHTGELGIGAYITFNIYAGGTITIGNGNVFSSTSGYNKFTNLQYGVQGDRANMTVQNNWFEDIATADKTEYGIFASSTVNYVNVIANLGEALAVNSYSNYFKNCNRGIYVLDYYYSNIFSNKMTNTVPGGGTSSIMREGIQIENCPTSHEIKNNFIENTDRIGIYGKNNGVSTISIHDNIVHPTMDIPTTLVRRGISVSNATPVTATVSIYKNEITNTRVGIQVINISTNASIRGNDIRVKYPGGAEPAKGIYALNCSNVWIDEYTPTEQNTIKVVCGAGTCDDKLFGIDIESCSAFRCYKNIVEDADPGIRASNNCDGGNFVCNEFYDCIHGFGLFNLEDINLGIGINHEIFGYYDAMFDVYYPSDNQWFPSTGDPSTWTNRTFAYDNSIPLATMGTSLNWYFASGANHLMMIPVGTLNTDDGSSVALDAGSLHDLGTFEECAVYPPRIGDGKTDASDAAIFDKMVEYFLIEMLTEEDALQKHITAEAAYQFMQMNKEVELTTDMAAALKYQIESTQMTLIFAIFDSINTRNFESANVQFESFSPIDESEKNIQTLLGIYLSSVDETGKYFLSEEDSLEILLIAKQAVQEAGTGVYIARAMLDTTFNPSISEEEEILKTVEENKVVIYPNPVQDILHLKFTDCKNPLTISVSNMQGIKIEEYEIENPTGTFNFDVSKLNPGIYIYIIKESGIIVSSERILKL